eukprot:TRINITY_DN7344_c0_g1_i2.p1 TRINITY_DN7344_c0_g1~~TRINITY_DN7344_c0_g1_i2.p1  ORF type:complete len:399 (+),score=52.56 TRINITY_DN7344_c0_g1_i2:81-1199(+)
MGGACGRGASGSVAQAARVVLRPSARQEPRCPFPTTPTALDSTSEQSKFAVPHRTSLPHISDAVLSQGLDGPELSPGGPEAEATDDINSSAVGCTSPGTQSSQISVFRLSMPDGDAETASRTNPGSPPPTITSRLSVASTVDPRRASLESVQKMDSPRARRQSQQQQRQRVRSSSPGLIPLPPTPPKAPSTPPAPRPPMVSPPSSSPPTAGPPRSTGLRPLPPPRDIRIPPAPRRPADSPRRSRSAERHKHRGGKGAGHVRSRSSICVAKTSTRQQKLAQGRGDAGVAMSFSELQHWIVMQRAAPKEKRAQCQPCVDPAMDESDRRVLAMLLNGSVSEDSAPPRQLPSPPTPRARHLRRPRRSTERVVRASG